MTAQQIIAISKHKPMNIFEQADQIAMEFRKDGSVYIPKDDQFFLPFLYMIHAIWLAGFISGVQAERKRRSRRTNKAEPDAKAS